jgi:opacity protein-like surface antigen
MNMSSSRAWVGVLSLAVAGILGVGSGAQAQVAGEAAGWYATGTGAYQHRQLSGESDVTWTTFDRGFDVGAGLGYQFLNGVGVDGEVRYARNATNVVAAEATGPAEGLGRIPLRLAMVNLRYAIPTGHALVPYVGLGIGGYRSYLQGVSNAIAAAPGLQVDGPSDGLTFAFQARAGVEVPVHPNAGLLVGYRYFRGGDLLFRGTTFGDLTPTGAKTHGLEAGMRFRF